MAGLETYAPYLAGTAAAILVWSFLKRSTRHLPFPPGPKPLPAIGNLLDFPSEKEWLVFRQWNEQYGDVVYTEALGQKSVFLGSADAVNDLLERRSAIYSDRPHMAMTHDLMDGNWILSLAPYGNRWREGRKLLHTYMHAGVASTFHPTQITAAQRLVADLLAAPQEPESLPKVVRLNVGQTIIKIVYGIDVKEAENEFITVPDRFNRLVTESMMPGRFLVDLVPALRYLPAWMPGAGFHAFGRRAAILSRKIRDAPVAVVKADMADGTAATSVVRSMLEKLSLTSAVRSSKQGIDGGQEGGEEELIKDVGAMAYLAGSDTTVAVIVSFFLAMVVYPDVQLKAQAEIDRVVGRERLPEVADHASLPYVSAVATECLRWLPVLPIGAPHMTTADDEYKGYFIPKGTAVFGSIWGILHNTKDYPDPEVFSPERYLIATGSGAYRSSPDAPDPRTAAFGFGRRVCIGRHVADASIFASIATALATINVLRGKDIQGQDIVPEAAQSDGLLSHPKPFTYSLEYRSDETRALLARALKNAEG